MRIDTIKAAASKAAQPPLSRGHQPVRCEASDQANPKIYGPLITSRPDGAGGPFNRWDREIAHWRAMGKPKLAADLQTARARLAITFETLEPVFIPTDGQRLLYGLRACPTGLRTMEAR